MKNMQNIFFIFSILLFISCGSVSSVVGNKTQKINTKCDNCTNTRQYYKAYGEAEIISGPRVKMAAISQARTFARNEMVKMLGTEGMSIAAQLAEIRTNVNSGGTSQSFKETMTQAFKEQAYAMLQNTEDDCLEVQTITKSRKGQEYVVVNVCIQMSKEEYADNIYRQNKEMFSQAKIDYKTFSIMLSATVKDK